MGVIPEPVGIFFQIHGSKFKLHPIAYLGQACESRIMIQDDWGEFGEGSSYTYNSEGLLSTSRYGIYGGGGCDVSYQYDIEGYLDTIITSYDVSTDKYWYGLDENSDTIILQKESWINAGVMEEYAVYQGNESYSITYQYKPFVVYGNGFTSLLDSHGNGNAVNYDAGSLLFSLNEFGFSNPQYTCDADGYLIKVIDGDTTYELYYE